MLPVKMEEARRVAEEEAENDIHAAYVNLNEAYIRLRTQKKVYNWHMRTSILSVNDM